MGGGAYMPDMPQDLASALEGEEEVQIEFTGQDGGKRKMPVWFAVEAMKLELLPMYGLETKWFKEVERSGSMVVSAKGVSKHASPTIVKDRAAVEQIKRRFAAKYGDDDVRKYYPTSQVALTISL